MVIIISRKLNKPSLNLIDDFRDIVKFNENSLKVVWDNEKDNVWNVKRK